MPEEVKVLARQASVKVGPGLFTSDGNTGTDCEALVRNSFKKVVSDERLVKGELDHE